MIEYDVYCFGKCFRKSVSDVTISNLREKILKYGGALVAHKHTTLLALIGNFPNIPHMSVRAFDCLLCRILMMHFQLSLTNILKQTENISFTFTILVCLHFTGRILHNTYFPIVSNILKPYRCQKKQY